MAANVLRGNRCISSGDDVLPPSTTFDCAAGRIMGSVPLVVTAVPPWPA